MIISDRVNTLNYTLIRPASQIGDGVFKHELSDFALWGYAQALRSVH